VPVETTKGEWSETGILNTCNEVYGKEEDQEEDVKTQSSFSSGGSSCILLQVYDLPGKLISARSMCGMASLNKSMSSKFSPGLFLLSGEQSKLKSQAKIQSSKTDVSKL
jgi:hypothetical protein